MYVRVQNEIQTRNPAAISQLAASSKTLAAGPLAGKELLDVPAQPRSLPLSRLRALLRACGGHVSPDRCLAGRCWLLARERPTEPLLGDRVGTCVLRALVERVTGLARKKQPR